MSDDDTQARDRCPICGYQFEEVQDVQTCPEGDRRGCGEVVRRENLIGEDDDYQWCL